MSEFAGIIRSLLWVVPTEEAAAAQNYEKLRVDRLIGLSPAERKLLDYLTQFRTVHLTAPSQSTVERWVEIEKDAPLTKIITDCGLENPWSGPDFEEAFEREVTAQASTSMQAVCQEALDIIRGDSKLPGTPKGVDAAVAHLFSGVKVPPPKDNTTMPADLQVASSRIDAEYQYRKANPVLSKGVPSGYRYIDDSFGGFRRKALYLHAGFAGHLKTTHMLNMVVNAVCAGWNEIVFTSEMPAYDVAFTLIAIHSANPKFAGIHTPLNQYKLILGILDDSSDESFYQDVKDDLFNNQLHGTIKVVDSSEFTTLGTVFRRAVQEDDKRELDMIWVDYITRLPVEMGRWTGFHDTTEAHNNDLVEAKRFAMSFKKGKGVAVGSPFQVNRAGFKFAKENDGKLDETCLAQFNAAEKEADGISYVWFGPEEQSIQEPKGGVIKSRWGKATVQTVALSVMPTASRRIIQAAAGVRIAPSTPLEGLLI